MKKEKFDEELKEALREYVKNTESEPTEKIKFSKRHEKNMEAIFKSIENGTLGNFEVANSKYEVKANTEIKSSARSIHFSYSRLVRVAIFVIFALIVSLAVAPGLEAWRTNELNLYGKNQDDYAWVLPNDVSEMLEVDNKSGEEYLEIFGYLPEGAEIEFLKKNTDNFHMKLVVAKKRTLGIRIMLDGYDLAVDTQDSKNNEVTIDGINISYTEKGNIISFAWQNNNLKFRLYGDIDYSELVRIIKSLNYEKIEKFF